MEKMHLNVSVLDFSCNNIVNIVFKYDQHNSKKKKKKKEFK